MKPVAIFAALRWECQPALRCLRQVQRTRIGGVPVWRGAAAGREVWVVQTGVGVERAAVAAAAVSTAAAFDLFVSTGCAGALERGLVPGDLALATAVVSETERFETDAGLRESLRVAAERAALRPAVGAVLCSPVVLATVPEKRRAAERGTIAVEMEGAPIAACAARAAIPFASVRSILDTADTELRHVGRFISPATGRVRPWQLARYLTRRPGAVADLLALQRMMHAARASLGRFFGAWLGQGT